MNLVRNLTEVQLTSTIPDQRILTRLTLHRRELGVMHGEAVIANGTGKDQRATFCAIHRNTQRDHQIFGRPIRQNIGERIFTAGQLDHRAAVQRIGITAIVVNSQGAVGARNRCTCCCNQRVACCTGNNACRDGFHLLGAVCRAVAGEDRTRRA